MKKIYVGIKLSEENYARLCEAAKNNFQSKIKFVEQATIDRIKKEETANE